MIKNVILISMLIGFILIANKGFTGETNKAYMLNNKGPAWYGKPFIQHGMNEIKFYMGFYVPNNWENELEINNQARVMASRYNQCHVAGGNWRWEILPEDSRFVLILTWFNKSNGQSGWCAIKNTDDYWYVASDSNGWSIMRSVIVPFQWNSNGTIITIQLRNPNNENGWTEHDIWYLFTLQ